MNIQTISTKKPNQESKEITLTLFCIKCRTTKTFIITQALKNLLLKNLEYIEYSSKCNSCGAEIGTRISWT